MSLTDLEIAVFGPRPNSDTIELFRYRCERAQRLLFQPKRRQRKPRQSPPGGLLTTAQAAAKLGCSVKTLNAHVANGDLKYVVIGRGSKRPRRYFTDADLNEFITVQTRKDSPCPSTAGRARLTGITTSTGEVIDFRGPRRPPTSGKRKR